MLKTRTKDKQEPSLRRTLLVSLLLVLLCLWHLQYYISKTEDISAPSSVRVAESDVAPQNTALIQYLIEIEDERLSSSGRANTEQPELKTHQLTGAADQAQESTFETDNESTPGMDGGPVVEGKSPTIRGNFDVPVLEYLAAVEHQAGGRLLVWDKASQRAVGEVVNGLLKSSTSLHGFSNRARDLTDDLLGHFREKVYGEVRKHHRFGIWRLVLVVPENAELQFQQAISVALSSVDLDWANSDFLQLRYQLNNGHVIAHIESVSVNGQTFNLNLAVRIW